MMSSVRGANQPGCGLRRRCGWIRIRGGDARLPGVLGLRGRRRGLGAGSLRRGRRGRQVPRLPGRTSADDGHTIGSLRRSRPVSASALISRIPSTGWSNDKTCAVGREVSARKGPAPPMTNRESVSFHSDYIPPTPNVPAGQPLRKSGEHGGVDPNFPAYSRRAQRHPIRTARLRRSQACDPKL